MEVFRTLIKADLDAVEQIIRDRLASEVPLIRQVAEYLVSSGGKRLRPALVVLAAGASGYHGRAHLEIAAVVEFIHTATLLHDDVVDESSLRRGRPTANASFGNAASVLVGDFIYSRAFQMMVGIGDLRVLEVLADATNVIAEGEVLQLLGVHNADLTEAEYLRVVRSKTAKLFEASARLGSVLARQSPAREQALAAYGMHLGTAFQLIDDVLDYSGDRTSIGKNLGDDLAEGKSTLPLIHALANAPGAQRVMLREVIEEGTVERFGEVLAALEQCGSLAYARDQAVREAQCAQDAIRSFPDSKFRDSLIDFAAFAVARDV
ncbi:MAG: octaprenyl diphosphate synthase [Rhodocyclaceae bacterium]|jgi:octaprenyl-diphosphate synthase|nr:octaprenyl diphosphate synthase [Rhodocyclaceae bacterium]MCE2979542.1 octaprenyl diphosphate synthase [Betaproteobacteria bacterium]MCA3074898.1 octaprenyl diphosphate synthase [Rhodocyclaceae bacterium]MCA3089716.1 octaprenyl diphosphate synthase [Rhodocyclaceae bacterium]MCA3094556.1 octaprenyl diphosphate synthase [Rhodocyclaceae bacterium]